MVELLRNRPRGCPIFSNPFLCKSQNRRPQSVSHQSPISQSQSVTPDPSLTRHDVKNLRELLPLGWCTFLSVKICWNNLPFFKRIKVVFTRGTSKGEALGSRRDIIFIGWCVTFCWWCERNCSDGGWWRSRTGNVRFTKVREDDNKDVLFKIYESISNEGGPWRDQTLVKKDLFCFMTYVLSLTRSTLSWW